MSKKKHEKSQKEIRQFIYDDYIFNNDLTSKEEVLKHIALLVDNDMASHISGKEDMSYLYVSQYKIASWFMCKYNKSLRKFKRRPLPHESMEYVTSDVPEEIIKMGKEGLDFGIHYANLGNSKHDDYAILVVEQDPEDIYVIGYDLYFIGFKHMKYRNKFFKKVDKLRKLNEQIKTERIVTLGTTPEYKEAQFKSFDNMVFTDKNRIIDYIDNWVNSIPIYHDYEMIPKLSILLYGDPGTGKSTFCKALAKHLGIESVGVITSSYFADDDANDYRGYRRRRKPQLNGGGIVYSLDDIDCLCKSREEDDSVENGKILGKLLEFLDNPETFYYKAKDGKYYPISIVVATTNYYDKLDAAVTRYGRFDLKIEMKPFNLEQAEEMCKIYNLKFKDIYKEKIDKDFKISPAYVQALCMENVDKSMKGEV